ncbi:hypothetical protein GALMADRAFT_90882 [Galerina marginata CBS 339.88]|uniref:non-specific serine/threonine protein kinase n=1 Tax=Galerina marginata (strain CBS 339.88) TaxID=685588 RepID=A0A067TNJ3_GALM3|nr:hypothetical protein GALMADRAFT_90882 [Galerina marginata CBS 339.88]
MTDLQSPFTVHTVKARRDPKVIGLWKVGRTLGKGFSGHVRIARHSTTGQYAAIKIISKCSLASRVSLNRIADEVEHNLLAVEREIVVMKLIDHPNIMKLYDVWETSSSLYLILEYVQGGELFDYLCTEGRRPTSEVVGYFQQIICAVDHCHRYNIAHRDLKLENILIDQDSNIKVADFGMATWQDDTRGKLLRTSCGSPHYAAPEIISGKPYNGSASDIWSCGIILYALLAAKLPFDDDDCPALLHKISLGSFVMPEDIDPRAQDLISRMLNTDVKKRIAMPEIMRHPFFLSQPLKNPAAMPSNPDMDIIARPVGSLSAIDPDIFANLRILWHGASDSELIAGLMSSERNWQKGIYHLLVNYRKRYLGLRQQEEEERSQANSDRRKSKRPKNPPESSFPPRDGPPTPRRARHPGGTATSSNTSLAPGQFPVISLSAPSPERKTPSLRKADDTRMTGLTAPQLENEKIQIFFQQIANHLNVLQAQTGVAEGNARSRTRSTSSVGSLPPVLIVPGIPLTPPATRHEIHDISSWEMFPLPKILGPQTATKPLTLRQKSRTPRQINTTDTNDKENVIPITESDIIHRQSPLTQHTTTMGDERHLQILATPVIRRPSKLKKKRISTGPVSPMFSEAGSSFTFPSPVGTPKRSWLDNVFKFKPVSYSLLSRYDVHTTRSECRRLLMEMDMVVSLEDSDKLGLLKCRSRDNKDGSNALLGLKSVKFRVEMRWPTPQLCQEGYLVSLLLVQEKGPLGVFKTIYHQLASTWNLAQFDQLPSISSRSSSRTGVVVGSIIRG